MSPHQAMSRALEIARWGAPFVSPNPKVGCVILSAGGEFLAEGYHQIFGGAHAEVNATQNLNHEKLQGAHVFVTLEPCAHEGKTPSCAQLLARLPIASVTYGVQDPNPLVSGQGAEILRQAGKRVQHYADIATEEMIQDLEELSEEFFCNFRENKVFVHLKVASSLDGFLGLSNGDSQWITNEQARERAHELRANHDAVMVGLGTLQTDNPSLNVRHPRWQKRNKVVILDPQGQGLKKLTEWNLFQAHADTEVFWVVDQRYQSDLQKNLKGREIHLIGVAADRDELDLEAVMKALWLAGIRSVLVEGGAQVLSSFLQQKKAHRLTVFQAPILLGKNGVSWNQKLLVPTMLERQPLVRPRIEVLGNNTMITGRINRRY